jgi:hypothetical protein
LVEIVRNIVKRDGVLGLWGKTSVILGFQSMIEKFGYFFAYTLLRSLYQRFVGSAPGAIMTLAIGYCSEWCQLPFTIPIDKVTVIMRNRMGTDQPQGLLACAGEVWRAGNLHAGIGGYTLLALKPATQFAAYEPAKAMWLARQGPGAELGAIASFCLGAYSRAVSDSVTCALSLSLSVLLPPSLNPAYTSRLALADPGRRAKVQKQALMKAKTADEQAMAKASVPSLVAYIVRTQGITGEPAALSTATQPSLVVACVLDALTGLAVLAGRTGLYKGLSMELFRGVLSGAVSMLVREQSDIISTRLILGSVA